MHATRTPAERRRLFVPYAEPGGNANNIARCSGAGDGPARAPAPALIARPACPPPPSWSPGASPPMRPDPTCDTAPGCRSGGRRVRPRSRGSRPACGARGRDSPAARRVSKNPLSSPLMPLALSIAGCARPVDPSPHRETQAGGPGERKRGRRGFQSRRSGGIPHLPAVRPHACAPARRHSHRPALHTRTRMLRVRSQACRCDPRGHRDAAGHGIPDALPARPRTREPGRSPAGGMESCGRMPPCRNARFRIRIALWMLTALESVQRKSSEKPYIPPS